MSGSSRLARLAAPAAVGVLAFVTSNAGAITMKNTGYDHWHQELADDPRYRSVGHVEIYEADDDNILTLAGFGSGVLIRDNWMLTAGHVVDTASYLNVNIGGDTYSASSWYTPSLWRRQFWKGNDIALIRLSSEVQGVAPAPLRTARNDRGKKATIVGYGTTGTALTGAVLYDAVKRAANNRLDASDTFVNRQMVYDFDVSPTSPSYIPSLDFDGEYGENDIPLQFEGSAAPGDSGGGVFIGNKLAGITSWGQGNSGAGTLGYSVRVAAWVSWINSVINRFEAGLQPVAMEGSIFDPIFAEAPEDEFFSQWTSKYLAEGQSAGAFAVPEPTTLLLMGATALGILARRSRPA